jgi:hypothetical protein
VVKIALQHWILEKCIDVFFHNLSRNFLFKPGLKVGEKLSYLLLKYVDDSNTTISLSEFFNVRINEIGGEICSIDYENGYIYDEPEFCIKEIPDKKLQFNNHIYHGLEQGSGEFLFNMKTIVKYNK